MSFLKVYTCTGFKGVYPVGTAAVIIAQHPVQAKIELFNSLLRRGLTPTPEEAEKWVFIEVDTERATAIVLADGNY